MKYTDIKHTQDRFNKKIDRTTACWNYTAGKDADGYGVFSVTIGNKYYSCRAHRISWILHNQQDWPDNKPVARHTCNNPSCVNPDHIIPGTQKENAADCYAAGRQSVNHKKIGQQVECPHCGKKGGLGIMHRWHFDNCKEKK